MDDSPTALSEEDTDDDHLRNIRSALVRLERVGFAANLRKSFATIRESVELGSLLTPTGLKPRPKKVEAIQRILVSTKRRHLRFLGMVNNYRDMWWYRKAQKARPCSEKQTSFG